MELIRANPISSNLLSAIGTFYLTGYAIGSIYGIAKRRKANYGAYLGNHAVVGGLIGLGIINLFRKK